MDLKTAKRIGITLECLNNFDSLIEACSETDVTRGCRYKALVLSCMDVCDGGGNGYGDDVHIDAETALRILPKIRALVIAELQALGAEVELSSTESAPVTCPHCGNAPCDGSDVGNCV